MMITMAHGSGGEETEKLIRQVFAGRFDNAYLAGMEDSAAVPGCGRLAVTTDSFIVRPLEFPGGDIGCLAVCGTVNDLLMRGALPKYLTCGFILEAGTDMAQLERVAASMADTALKAGVLIVAGDTKVVENTHEDGGIVINTAGVGFLEEGRDISASSIRAGDQILLSGTLGDHHAAIQSARMGLKNDIRSDVGLLTDPVTSMLAAGLRIHAMRDVTRGGLATILNEFAGASGLTAHLEGEAIPVRPAVRDFCGILGLDPLTMGNEGKMIAVVDKEDADEALRLMRETACGREAVRIGEMTDRADACVILHTAIGGERIVAPLVGEGLPRIC